MRYNNTQSIYYMSAEDKTVPEDPDNPAFTEQWEEFMRLVKKHNMYRDGAVKAGRVFGAATMIKLIDEIVGENEIRSEKQLGKINVGAQFRQRVRRWKTTEKQQAAQVVQEVHIAKVMEEYDNGFRPIPEKLLDGVAELVASDNDDDAEYTAEQLAVAGRFLKSMAV